jgi:hypothetical protein
VPTKFTYLGMLCSRCTRAWWIICSRSFAPFSWVAGVIPLVEKSCSTSILSSGTCAILTDTVSILDTNTSPHYAHDIFQLGLVRVPENTVGFIRQHWFFPLNTGLTGFRPQHWFHSATLVSFRNTGFIPQHWFPSATLVSFRNTGFLPQHWFHSATRGFPFLNTRRLKILNKRREDRPLKRQILAQLSASKINHFNMKFAF